MAGQSANEKGVQRGRSSLFVYNAALIASAAILAPLIAVACLLRPRWRERLGDRFGLGWPESSPRPTLWAHGASVGEIEGIAPLLQRWKDENPGGRIVVSSLTATGCAAATRAVPGAEVRAFPLDLPGIPGRVVRRLSPDLFLFSENELWPNALTSLSSLRVPSIQVSGRVSERAARTLKRTPGLAGSILSSVTRFCVQSPDDKARLLALGADADCIVVTGSLKGDGRRIPTPPFVDALEATGRPILVAGSTHEGEEEVVAEAMVILGRREKKPLWILAPRHPERFDSVAAELLRCGHRMIRRSEMPSEPAEVEGLLDEIDVILLDTLGELAGCYRSATACFVGGSLVPIGGHNLLEPAREGTLIAVGPHVDSVRTLVADLSAHGAAGIAEDGAALAEVLERFLRVGRGSSAARAAQRVAAESAGGVDRTWIAVEEVLRTRSGAPPASRNHGAAS